MPKVRYRSLSDMLGVSEVVKKKNEEVLKTVKLRKPKQDREHEEQVKLFQWKAENLSRYPDLIMMYSVPNGAKVPFTRRKDKTGKWIIISRERTKLMKEGLTPGVPDVQLDASRGPYHGLRIEMKIKNNRATPEQLKWHSELKKRDYYVQICWSFEEARDLIIRYLNNEL